MSINYGIQICDITPLDNNLKQNINERNPAEFSSSIPAPQLIEPGDQILVKSAFLNLRSQNNGNIILETDSNITIKFYHYYIPQFQDGIDTSTSSSNQFSGVDVPAEYQGNPYILMVRKDYYNTYLLPALQNAGPDNPANPPPLFLFDADKLYTNANYGTVWTWDDFTPLEFYWSFTIKAGSYAPSYLAQLITQAINTQPNGTNNNNWNNQPPLYPNNTTPYKNIMYNPDYSNNIQWNIGPGFAYEWFGGAQSNNVFYYNLMQIMNVEFYNAWYNNAGNRKTFVYLFKNLYNDTFFHNSLYMYSGTTQATCEFNTNNSGLFSFNTHSPIYNNNNLSILYRAYSAIVEGGLGTLQFAYLFSKQGGVMFSGLNSNNGFWEQLGFDNSIIATFDDPSGQWRMTSKKFNSVTSDTYTTISQINANSNYAMSNKPIYTGDEPSPSDYQLYFQSQDFIEIYAKNTFVSSNEAGHYLLELNAYPSSLATNTTYTQCKLIIPTYYNINGSNYIYANQINSFPSVYTHFGEPFLFGFCRVRILKPNLETARISTGNYIYLEVIKPIKNILKSIKDNPEQEENEKQQQTLYAGQK
jgi:hypothetical protein